MLFCRCLRRSAGFSSDVQDSKMQTHDRLGGMKSSRQWGIQGTSFLTTAGNFICPTITSQLTRSFISQTCTTRKKLMLLSSQHTQSSIDTSGKLEVTGFYNASKGKTDTFDRMCTANSCSHKTRRPLCILYGMLNDVSVNCFIIHSENVVKGGSIPMGHKKFKLQVRRH